MTLWDYLVVTLAFDNAKGYVVQYTAPLPMAVSVSTDVGWRERVSTSNVGIVF